MLTPSATEVRRIRIWDLPLRLFHWSFAACVIGAFITVKTGNMEWHLRLGLAALCLIIFRILWGFSGTYYARFTQFIKGPTAIIDYLKSGQKVFGHNPLGALSVLALLGLFGLQVVSGLFTGDGYFYQGPLYRLAAKDIRELMAKIHHSTELLMILLVVLHVGAVLFYRFIKKQNLITPMITGQAQLSNDVPTAAVHVEQGLSMWLRFVLSFGIAVLITYYIANGLSF
ncbi:cytochrome b/b6 domain-containing protein [Oligella urethralis]|mgnify:FL=1|uniref:cytochrome b/b6 domain-containing protein n=1 Tax=Oligella urethralis TaxID=90245 RepID=UPI0003618493|nr:cytochrome b/b6 domain-containing protein [Oligella urethralis]SUA54692.1 Cytochrome b [Oligella urethralis]SUA64974.1 Cytochrome b [Oligella urethralis]SUA66502.1 Cytochrome b [Oligella urethralis]